MKIRTKSTQLSSQQAFDATPSRSGHSPAAKSPQPTHKILTLEIEVMEERIAPGQEDRWRLRFWGNRCETILGDRNGVAQGVSQRSYKRSEKRNARGELR